MAVPEKNVHAINLRGPWQMDCQGNLTVSRFPCCVSASDPFRLTRKFHQPSGLTDQQIVALKIRLNILPGSLVLNGTALDMPPGLEIEWEVGPLLRKFNQLDLFFGIQPASEPAVAIFESVLLEIRSPD